MLREMREARAAVPARHGGPGGHYPRGAAAAGAGADGPAPFDPAGPGGSRWRRSSRKGDLPEGEREEPSKGRPGRRARSSILTLISDLGLLTREKVVVAAAGIEPATRGL